MKGGMGSPDWNVSMVDIHHRKLLWVYCPGHAVVKGNDRADRLAGKANTTGGLRLGRSEVLRSFRHCLPSTYHSIDHLEERERDEVERGNKRSMIFFVRTRERVIDRRAVGPTLELAVSKSANPWGWWTGGVLLKRLNGVHKGFPERVDSISTCAKLKRFEQS